MLNISEVRSGGDYSIISMYQCTGYICIVGENKLSQTFAISFRTVLFFSIFSKNTT